MREPDLPILAALMAAALCSAYTADTLAAPTKLVSAARPEPSDILNTLNFDSELANVCINL